MVEQTTQQVAVVAIGRNEGQRLERCLQALAEHGQKVIYVDSGSTDGSVAMARGLGVQVVELDMSVPFTAARARNHGLAHMAQLGWQEPFVQFVDGDCEFVPGWLESGCRALEADPKLAAVCGRVRERHRGASIYNRLCDMEWDGPVGEVNACGGNAMMRVAAVLEVGGFNPNLIAGEEPELCLRLRAKGWRIQRLAAEMVLHDADMTRFSQWWRRAVRGGYAYAQSAAMHARTGDRPGVRESLSIWFWTVGLVGLAGVLACWTSGLSLLLLAGYPLLALKIARGRHNGGDNWTDGLLYGVFITLGKWAQLVGQGRYWIRRALGRQAKLIEYKAPPSSI
ncbi:MAG: glycosyltransferase [Phycisphaeraceae bacterium]|nr:glycosyltransferase [Phycisphaeraceae bacterium]